MWPLRSRSRPAPPSPAAGRPPARRPADDPERLVPLHLVAPVGMTRQLVEVDRPDVGLETRLGHPGGDPALRRRLLAVEAGDRDQLAQEGDQAVEVERRERAALGAAELAAHAAAAHSGSRSTGRVRQVGPPSALNDSGSPGKVTTSQPAISSRLLRHRAAIEHDAPARRDGRGRWSPACAANSSSGTSSRRTPRRRSSAQKAVGMSGG